MRGQCTKEDFLGEVIFEFYEQGRKWNINSENRQLKKKKTIQIVEKNQDCLLRAMRNQGFQQDSDKI